MGLLLRLGEYGYGVLYPDILAVIGERFIGCPRLQQDFKRFLELAARFTEVAAEACHFVALVASADAAHQPAVYEIIEHRKFFGEAQRLPYG